MPLTPEQEAAYALDYGLSRADLSSSVQAEYDRQLAERRAAPAQRTAAEPAPATWQGSPQASQRWRWPAWALVAAFLAFVAAFIVGGHGTSQSFNGADLAAGLLFLFSLAGAAVGIPAALVIHFRARRIATRPQEALPYTACYGCGYPHAAHSGADLRCPRSGICYRCGQPFTTHLGYELTCPPGVPLDCYLCGQPFAAHAGGEQRCPVPPSP